MQYKIWRALILMLTGVFEKINALKSSAAILSDVYIKLAAVHELASLEITN